MTKVIFIDRDGVINKDLWKYVENWEEFEFLPGVLESLKLLHDNGFKVIVVSNQAGVGDGIYTKAALDDITRRMTLEVKKHGGYIAATLYCIHRKQDGCRCRKPNPGLFEQAAEKFSFDKATTYFIGDKLSDVKAGKNAGLKTIMVMTGYGAKEKELITDETRPDFFAADLGEALTYVLPAK
jgi:D-glycero-D-manno-heptose 1,7-bisphosphate phosphatase